MNTPQMETWTGDFGREYTDRNSLTLADLDSVYQKRYGVTRRELNARFLSVVPADARILEVGCNLGNQLLLLQEAGYRDLYGIEIQEYALTKARSRLSGVQLVQATAFDIPFADKYFDLVFTSGVLIHIAPDDLPKAIGEIHRCVRSFIWGIEYHSSEPAAVNYRGHQELLWKMDYAKFYLDHFDDLELTKSEHLPYLDSPNVDCMFLLRKRNGADF
jgi:pseudaminic acid biosynthesis-associated methylase